VDHVRRQAEVGQERLPGEQSFARDVEGLDGDPAVRTLGDPVPHGIDLRDHHHQIEVRAGRERILVRHPVDGAVGEHAQYFAGERATSSAIHRSASDRASSALTDFVMAAPQFAAGSLRNSAQASLDPALDPGDSKTCSHIHEVCRWALSWGLRGKGTMPFFSAVGRCPRSSPSSAGQPGDRAKQVFVGGVGVDRPSSKIALSR
jgi:hypothetical protein